MNWIGWSGQKHFFNHFCHDCFLKGLSVMKKFEDQALSRSARRKRRDATEAEVAAPRRSVSAGQYSGSEHARRKSGSEEYLLIHKQPEKEYICMWLQKGKGKRARLAI